MSGLSRQRRRRRARMVLLVLLPIAVVAAVVIVAAWVGDDDAGGDDRLAIASPIASPLSSPIAASPIAATPLPAEPVRRIAVGRTEFFYGGDLAISLLAAGSARATAVVGSPGERNDDRLRARAIGDKITVAGLTTYEVRISGIGDGWAEFNVTQLSPPSRRLDPPRIVELDEGRTADLFGEQLSISLRSATAGVVEATISSPGSDVLVVENMSLGHHFVYIGSSRYDIRIYFIGERLAEFAVWQLPPE